MRPKTWSGSRTARGRTWFWLEATLPVSFLPPAVQVRWESKVEHVAPVVGAGNHCFEASAAVQPQIDRPSAPAQEAAPMA